MFRKLDKDCGFPERRRQLGLTLLELLIAMAVAGIVAAVGVPAFRAFSQNQNRLTGTTELAYTLGYARSEAIKRAQFVTVCRSVDQSSCSGAGADWTVGWIVFSNTAAANATVRNAGEPVLHSFATFPANIALSTADLAPGLLTFRPSGDLGISATWTWCDARGAAEARGVVVDEAGRARVSDVDANGDALVCP